jgi:hypothetical protein
MNCNTCRYELSQCLDGRLPSGRRAVVMQHLTECEVCASFWSELQAAQQLTLQLPKEHVSEGFREQLWERIRAGEGTPDAVFHEPVPLLTKARYALTGAAAAAAVLLASTWLRNDHRAPNENQVAEVKQAQDSNADAAQEDRAAIGGGAVLVGGQGATGNRRLMPRQDLPDEDSMPAMFASAQPLTADLVAKEAARQFEQRYVSANRNLAQLATAKTRNDSQQDTDLIVGRLLDGANELHLFAEVLLDLRDNNRVFFPDAEVGANLRLVSNMLGQTRGHNRNLDTVQSYVAPALRQSDRLGNIAQLISLRPSYASYDPIEGRAEQEMLRQLSTLRPDVFPKLFFVLPSTNNGVSYQMLQNGELFAFDSQCGPSFVAPRSRVEESNQRFRLRIDSSQQGAREVHVEIHVDGGPKPR